MRNLWRPRVLPWALHIMRNGAMDDPGVPSATDFGRDVFQKHYQRLNVYAHLFDGYWEDLGTIKSYHQAALDLATVPTPHAAAEAAAMHAARPSMLSRKLRAFVITTIHTTVASCGTYPANQESRLSCVVPVLPATGRPI